LHCHVSDHMESGMMATYTIYEPQHCSTPMQFVSANLWPSGKAQVTVRNVGAKAIKAISVSFDYLTSPQARRRSFDNQWNWITSLQPGQTQSFEVDSFLPKQQAVGYILFPKLITFADGTHWNPKTEGECFETYWRENQHSRLPVLPPLQMELNED